MMKNSLFQPYNDQFEMLARHLPDGKFWQNKFNPDSNIGKLVAGLAVEFFRLQVLTNEVYIEFDINQTDELLIDWEKSVGIPNECFDTNLSIENRREQVLQVFTNFGGVQTDEDYIRVAKAFGFDIAVFSGSDVGMFPLSFPILFFDSAKSAAHTIFIQVVGQVSGDSFFPLPFPLPFSSGGTTFLKCIFDALSPANVQVIVQSEAS